MLLASTILISSTSMSSLLTLLIALFYLVESLLIVLPSLVDTNWVVLRLPVVTSLIEKSLLMVYNIEVSGIAI